MPALWAFPRAAERAKEEKEARERAEREQREREEWEEKEVERQLELQREAEANVAQLRADGLHAQRMHEAADARANDLAKQLEQQLASARHGAEAADEIGRAHV